MLNVELQTFIADLMRITNRVSTEKFKGAVTRQLQKLIPFDMALWADGYTKTLQLNSVFLYNLPESLMEHWEQVKHQDRLLAGLIASPGVTCDIFDYYSRYERTNLVIYRKHSKLFGIEHAISTALPDPDTGLLEIISLYRRSSEKPFSSAERLVKQFIFPLITNARCQNQIKHLDHLSTDTVFVILCDKRGWIRVADPGFITLLKEQWPKWSGPILPDPILYWMKNRRKNPLKKNTTRYYWEKANDLILLTAIPQGEIVHLTRREYDIATLYASGLTHKQVACKLHISPNTVRRHIESIYKKLNISQKIALQHKLDLSPLPNNVAK